MSITQGFPAITTLTDLSHTLHLDKQTLFLMSKYPTFYYVSFSIPKKDGDLQQPATGHRHPGEQRENHLEKANPKAHPSHDSHRHCQKRQIPFKRTNTRPSGLRSRHRPGPVQQISLLHSHTQRKMTSP